jgi:hypothetical protein
MAKFTYRGTILEYIPAICALFVDINMLVLSRINAKCINPHSLLPWSVLRIHPKPACPRHAAIADAYGVITSPVRLQPNGIMQ